MIAQSASTNPFRSTYRSATALARFASSLLFTRQRKHLVKWLRSQRRSYLMDTPSPWLTFDAIEFLQNKVRPDWKVFEYGSGGSTLFWLQFCGSCVSIEHDPEWHSIIEPRVRGRADYRRSPPQQEAGSELRDPSDPDSYTSAAKEFRGYSFGTYASEIDRFADESFDLVLIDGRARPSCIKHSVSKVKDGGYLIVDNAERSYYTIRCGTLLAGFEKMEFAGALPLVPYLARTDIYVKGKRKGNA